MQMLMYASPTNTAALRLLNTLGKMTGAGKVCYFDSIQMMHQFLRQPLGIELIIILFPPSRQELGDLLKVRPLMHDARIILILPDEQIRTITDGHLLRPRFITTAGGDLSDVVAVAHQMTTFGINGRTGLV